jgi:hypothetical protein
MQNYGQHNSHRDWKIISSGYSNKNKRYYRGVNKSYVVDINDDEAILIEKSNV